MKVGLIDVDGHNFPNIPLMKISAFHKREGDSVEWYKGILSDHMNRVYMSKVFNFTQDYPWVIDADEIVKGGSGYAIRLEDGKEVYHKEIDNDLPYEVEHMYPDYSLYPSMTKDTAYGFLTRGCPRGCSFCHVEAKEGRCSRKVADLDEFWKGQKKIVLCDPNILASADHKDLLQQLADSKARVEFNQGLDIRLISDSNIDQLRKVNVTQIHFAYDRYQDKDIIEPRLKAFSELGYNRSKGKVMVYILVNYDTTLEQDIERIQYCRELNFAPYPMIYDKEHANPIYRRLQRWCNNFIFWGVPTFEEYNSNIRWKERKKHDKRNA